jgi:hypothetical protein
LKQHTQTGFAADHFEMIDQIKNVQAILFRALQDESSKEYEKNLIVICKISSTILQNVQILRQLIVDTPFVARMKEEIDKAREIQRLNDKKVKREPIPTALTIDPDSIAGKPVEKVDDNDDPVVE